MHDARTTRRDFHRQLAGLAVAPALGGGPAPQPVDTARALTDLLRRRYGRHLREEELRLVGLHVAANQQAAERLARIPLTNGDGPAFSFRADVP